MTTYYAQVAGGFNANSGGKSTTWYTAPSGGSQISYPLDSFCSPSCCLA
jgi:hypothetical protein